MYHIVVLYCVLQVFNNYAYYVFYAKNLNRKVLRSKTIAFVLDDLCDSLHKPHFRRYWETSYN